MMIKQILLFVGFVFIAANVVPAQTRTVTNSDLEKFRQKRVQAEQEYRENYEKLGLPSPEELDIRREQNGRDLAALSERLRNENLEREKIEREDAYRQAQIEYLRGSANQYNQSAYNGNGYYSSGYFGAYPYYGFQSGYYNNNYNNRFGGYYNNRLGGRRGFGRGRNFYNSIAPGTPFSSQGVRINTGGVRINVTGGGRSHSPIGNPR